MASTKEKIIQVVDDNKTKLINGALVVGGIYLTYRLGKNIIASLNKSDAQNKADDSPEVRQAMSLRSAMNPSGISWMKFPDGRTGNDYLEISFESAWCPPENVYAAMIQDGWYITAYFYEPGMGFVGKYGTDLDGIYEESYEINNEPIPAELVEMFGIQEMFDDGEYELVENDDGFYEVKEIENAD